MKPIFHQLVVKEIRQETSESVSISFDIPFEVKEHYRFKPGQYLTIKYFHEGVELRRSYSICSAPFENELRVAVKKILLEEQLVAVNRRLSCFTMDLEMIQRLTISIY